MKKGMFIVLEGPDKAGKSTQARLLVKALRGRGLKVVHSREPGGTPLAEEIRRILLRPGRRVVPVTELLLYEAARAQHVAEKIRPALESGKVVVCERFTVATVAYQGSGRGLPLGTIFRIDSTARDGVEPDMTVVLDIPEERFQTRMEGKRFDRIEREGAEFRARIRKGYRSTYLEGLPLNNLKWVDADRPMDQVHKEILTLTLSLLGRGKKVPLSVKGSGKHSPLSLKRRG